MGDLISREAIMWELLELVIKHSGAKDIDDFACDVRNALEAAHASDAVEVVRCYQCKYYLKAPMICEREDGLWAPDKLDYCSFGERWDGE